MAEPVSGTGRSVVISFVVALTTIAVATVAGIVTVAIMVKDSTSSIVLIGLITAFATSIGASIIGLFSLLFQVRGEMNGIFAQLLKAKTDLSYNAGMTASEAGSSAKRGS